MALPSSEIAPSASSARRPAAGVTEAEREAAYMAAWRPYYHAVATVAELDAPRLDEHGRQQPLPVELMGEHLILARLDGRLAALDGRCPHRGVSLEVGWVSDDRQAIVCRYHGAHWCQDGHLGVFPAMAAEGHRTPNWCIGSYPVIEQHGLVWVSLDPQPRSPVLELPEAADPNFVHLPIYTATWRAGVGRMIEAQLDVYHFAFTHVGTIGDPNNPRAPRTDVAVRDGRLQVQYTIDQPANAGIAEPGADQSELVPVTYQIRAAPNAARLTKISPAGNFIIYFACTPLAPRRSRLYRLIVRDHDKDVPDEVFIELENLINWQDQLVVEHMEPWESTTALDEEKQVYMDKPTIAYRRWLGSLGMRYM